MDVQRILVPIDYSADSQRALQWGASLAAKYEAKLILLHVVPKALEMVYPQGFGWESAPASIYGGVPPGKQPSGAQPIVIDLVDRGQTQLDDFAAQYLKAPVPMQIKVTVGKPAEEILRVAREEKVDLVVMGTHGRTGLRHLVLGSVAAEVARHAPCPVFTVRIGVEAAA
jgi:nucleotide-binding universal stress UspA family protein